MIKKQFRILWIYLRRIVDGDPEFHIPEGSVFIPYPPGPIRAKLLLGATRLRNAGLNLCFKIVVWILMEVEAQVRADSKSRRDG